MEPSIYELVRQWVTTGELAESDKPTLKAQYLRDIGAPADCKTCGNVWLDIRQHFFYKYKQLNQVKQIVKYIILTGGYLQLPGDNTLYVLDGPETNGRKLFTDEVAEHILADNPGYLNTLIGLNPNYKEPTGEELTAADRDTQIETLTAERDTAKKVLEFKDKELEKVTGQYNTAVSDLDSKSKELETVKADLKTDRTKLTKATNEIERLKADNAKLSADLAALAKPATEPTSSDSQSTAEGTNA